MNEAWRIKENILVSDKILIFSLFVGCIYRKGPALTYVKRMVNLTYELSNACLKLDLCDKNNLHIN